MSFRLLVNRYANAVFAVCVLSIIVAGCHRGYYRRQADSDAQMLIEQKTCDPRWGQIDPTIEIDPRSRMFDPFSADHPPLPPDDPESHKLMERVDGKPGYPHWHANGDTQYVENPEWLSYVPMNEKGELVLDQDTAVLLALIHSGDFQTQRETLYLSALEVSLQRFGFDSQLFASVNSFFRSNGEFRGGTNTIGLENGRVSLQRLGITGSTLAIGLANTIVWNFAGNNTQTANSLINFSFIQPLLRGGGRDRILESLTQTERNLLTNIRQMERFRQGFYLSITTGRNPGQGVGGSGLGTPGSAQAQAGGFLGLLNDLQAIRIQERNVVDQEEILEQFRAFFREERIDLLQVTQVEGNFYNAQRQLAQLRTNYQNSLDQFKITLGLPPDLPVVISDQYLSRFELISNTINDSQSEIKSLRSDAGQVLTRLNNLMQAAKFDADPVQDGSQFGVVWTDDYSGYLKQLMPILEKLDPIRQSILTTVVEEVRIDLAKLDAIRPERIESLRRLQQIISENPDQYNIATAILDEDEVATVEALEAELAQIIAKIEQSAAQVASTIAMVQALVEEGESLPPQELFDRLTSQVSRQTPELITQLSNLVLELSLVQARARSDAIILPEIDLSWQQSIAIAKCFRLDWMNARAALVDRYRRIELIADDLESQLDLVFEGEMGNDGNNPFKVRYENGSLGVGVRFDAPITRLSERNRYREALIQYQQARRSYYQFKDAVKRNLRQSIRVIELNKILFELDRRSVRIAVQEVELARLRLEQPPTIQRALGGGSGFSDQTAANLTNALNGLQQTQNRFLSTWVNFEAQRRGLDFDLGTMRLTPDGYWVDPGDIDETIAVRAAEAFGIICDPCASEIDPYSNFYDHDIPGLTDWSTQSGSPELEQIEPGTYEFDGKWPGSNSRQDEHGNLLDPRSDMDLNPPPPDGAKTAPVSGRSAILPVRNLPIFR